MNKTYKFPALWMMCLMLFSCLTFTACDNGDDEDTNQYKGGISLNVFGPSPVSAAVYSVSWEVAWIR